MKLARGTTDAWIALGSNLGDRRVNLEVALARLSRLRDVRVVAASTWHETEPVGGPEGQSKYLNGVARLAVGPSVDARALLAGLLEIEAAAGRTRMERDAPRTLDLDLLFFGDERRDEPDLTLPHPRLEQRAFVLAPLCELDPERRLSISGRSVRERCAELLRGKPAPAHRDGGLLRMESPDLAAAWCERSRAQRRTLGFVPTMGALHEGHLELVRRAAQENDAAVVSVFVNPLQFNDAADFARYPRDFERDSRLLESAGAKLVFTGSLAQFFPGRVLADGGLEPAAWIEPGPASLGLEGEHRPGHFRGVATIVARLFDLVRPDRAYFGQKDFQQTCVVRDLVSSRGGPRVEVCATSREPSGLARSSRNERLSAADRERAAELFAALSATRDAWLNGERRAEVLRRTLSAALTGAGLEFEYAELRDPERWTSNSPSGNLPRAIALIAARVGTTRLIDNLRLDPPSQGVR